MGDMKRCERCGCLTSPRLREWGCRICELEAPPPPRRWRRHLVAEILAHRADVPGSLPSTWLPPGQRLPMARFGWPEDDDTKALELWLYLRPSEVDTFYLAVA
jgi:hypothetical protein